MKTNKHNFVATLVFIAITLLPGCASLNNAHQTLVEHPKRTVRYPARVGETVGMVIGIPVGLVLAIPTMIAAHLLPLDEETKAWSGLYPFSACCDLGTVIIGGIPWCLVGWRGLPQPKPETEEERANHLPRGTYVETENGGMIIGEDSTNGISRNIEEK